MGELSEKYKPETQRVIDDFMRRDKSVANCAVYQTTEFMGTSNACVCSRMGHTEAATIMRDGLMEEFLRTGTDDLLTHFKFVAKTWSKPGGGLPLVGLILENGLTCPGRARDALERIGEAYVPD